MKKLTSFFFFLFFLTGVTIFGQSWTELNSNSQATLRGCHFVHPDTVFFVGSNHQIIRTTDGGATFGSTTYSAGAGEFYDVFFTNGSTGYIVGNGGQILKTTNSGDAWTTLNSGTQKDLRCIRFISTAEGFAIGSDCSVFRTVDAGLTWNQQSTPIDNSGLYGIDFTTADNGFAAGWNGRIYKTTDGGAHWAYTQIATEPLLDVHFINPLIGFVIGDHGLIKKTTDGGVTWNTINSGSFSSYFTRIWFTDLGHGFIAGGDVTENDGTITTTNDGGNTWTTEYTGTSRLYGLYMGPFVGYACGLNGTIIKYKRGMDINSIPETQQHLSIYPNPANEFTTIVLPESLLEGYISIFDLTGHQVYQISCNGNNTLQFSTEKLTPGHYFIRVTTKNGKSATGKLQVTR